MARAIDVVQVKAEIAAEKLAVIIENGSVLLKDMQSGEAVKIATLTPPNEPLTIEQLRDMDGEPVWVQTPGIPQYGRWVIVAGVDMKYGQSTLYCQGDYTCRNYGRDWIAYRRPPEGEEDT